MPNYGYQQYKEQSVNTMTSGEMLVLLYDEALKRLSRSEMALKNEDFALFEASIDRVTAIVHYLDETLNKKYTISIEMSRLYEYFLFQLTRIKIGRNIILIQELRPMILDLRETFKEADKISNEKC